MLELLTCAFPYAAYSQVDSLSRSVNVQASETKSKTPVHSLYAGAGSGSNMIYLGSSISQNHPFYSASVIYGFRNSIFASVSTTHITAVNPFNAFYSLSLNYSHTFNSWFDISSDIAGYKAPQSLQETLFSNFLFINITAGIDWKLLYTKVSFGGLISENTQGYLQVRNSRYFETPAFFKGKCQISFDPNINMLFGELIKINSVTGITKYNNPAPFRHLKKNPNGTAVSYTSKFGLMDFEFSFPVTFSYSNISFVAEPDYILPAHTNSDYPAPKGFSFFLNIYLKII